jgi:antitoxin ParD1/3/4
MNVVLAPEVRKFVEQKMRSGQYHSPDDAVNGLLRFLQHQEELSPEELEELRAEVDAGIADADAGRFVEFSAEDIIAERLAAKDGGLLGTGGAADATES